MSKKTAQSKKRDDVSQASWEAEDRYWRGHYQGRPYAGADTDYAIYRPAYQLGHEARQRFHGREFEEIEERLQKEWEEKPISETLTWDYAKNAVKDAYLHHENEKNPGSPTVV